MSSASQPPAEPQAPAPKTATKESEFVKEDSDQGVLYVGIDLGTSRSAVAASNGVRESVESFVGYPKDAVARKLLKRDVLYGQEAKTHRLSCNFFRPLEHGVIKFSGGDSANGTADETAQYAKAATDLVEHVVSLARPRADELVYAVIGAPALAGIHNKEAIIDAARKYVDAVMIASEPFSVAYGMERLTGALVIDIGAGTTDFCRMMGAMPTDADQFTNTFAGDHVDKVLYKLLKEACPGAAFNIHMVKAIKEKYGHVGRYNEKIFVEFPVDGKPTRFEISAQLKKACHSIIPPMVKAVQKLIADYEPDFQAQLRGNIVLGGGGSQIVGLDDALEVALQDIGGGQVTRCEEPVFAGANGALKLAHDMPAEYWKALA